MRRLRHGLGMVVAAAAVLSTALTLGTTPVAASGHPTMCGPHTVVGEVLSAPHSSPTGSPFTVKIVLKNCTGVQQSIALEGRLTPPPHCTAPIIDPLPLSLSPHQKVATSYVLQTQSTCHGHYTVQVSVAQGSKILARRSVTVTIV